MRFVIVVLCLLTAACGGGSSSPTAPTPVAQTPTPAPAPTPAPTPTPPPPTIATVFGVVTDAHTGAPIGGMAVSAWVGTTIVASTSTDGNGYYSMPAVPVGPVQITYLRDGYNSHTERPTVAGDMRVDARVVPFWQRTGVGDNVFDMPSYVRRVRIRGHYPSSSSNFIVRIGGRLVVNELLGYSWSGPTFEGTYVTNGGVVEITRSRDVQWTFTQVQ